MQSLKPFEKWILIAAVLVLLGIVLLRFVQK